MHMTCLYILVLLVLLSGVCVCLSVCPLPHVNMARGELRVSKPKFEGPLIANMQNVRKSLLQRSVKCTASAAAADAV